jgi:hypothetical protein
MQQVEPEAADRDLVAVAQGLQLHLGAVDEDAVEAAVVEHAQLLAGLGDDQRVAARDGRVVEADIGVLAAADPGPAAFDREGLDPLAVVVDEVVAVARQGVGGGFQPLRQLGVRGQDLLGGRRFMLLAGAEDRVAAEAGAAAAGAFGQLIGLAQGQLGAAGEAEVGAATGYEPTCVAVVQRVGADAVEDDDSPSRGPLRS